ncbi:MAG: transposase [Myxococcales bacterium]|nr:transposase [Myxococcales bacterium]
MGEKRQTRTYDQELCEHAVRQVFDGERTLTEVAYALGINHWTLRDWVRAERARRVVEGQPMPKKKRRSTRHKATGAGKSASVAAPQLFVEAGGVRGGPPPRQGPRDSVPGAESQSGSEATGRVELAATDGATGSTAAPGRLRAAIRAAQGPRSHGQHGGASRGESTPRDAPQPGIGPRPRTQAHRRDLSQPRRPLPRCAQMQRVDHPVQHQTRLRREAGGRTPHPGPGEVRGAHPRRYRSPQVHFMLARKFHAVATPMPTSWLTYTHRPTSGGSSTGCCSQPSTPGCACAK